MGGAHLPPTDLTWIGSDRRLARRVGRPMARFLAIEAASGILLIAATIIAIVWANSPWSDSYDELLHLHIGFEVGSFRFDESLLHWVNDGLMAIFFFVVGLEIKRELVAGELRDPRAAMLPAVAALGGMIVPATVFLMLAPGSPESQGWGIPMATDIAFALGIASLLGKRVPTSLKIFLMTLAIVDDIGAIAVIAIFYTSGVAFEWLITAVVLLVVVALLTRARVWYTPIYVALGVATWFAMFESGIHATIAGVALGLLAPARPLQQEVGPDRVFGTVVGNGDEPVRLDGHTYRRADLYIRECVPVAERLQTLLHPFSSFVIIPVFALANAGIVLSIDGVRSAATSTVTLGIVAGLVVGKTVGVSVASWLAVKSGACTLPRDVTWPQVVSVSTLAGIGFTVALFISGLAYADEALVTEAKMGILAASLLAAVVGAAMLARSTRDTLADVVGERIAGDDVDGADGADRDGPDDHEHGFLAAIADRLEPIGEIAHESTAPTHIGADSDDAHESHRH